MEYIFGRNDFTGVETLRTKGGEHTDLTGFCETVREFEDTDVTDSFYVVGKTHSDEDSEGNCYDWYDIDKHKQRIDNSKVLQQRMEEVLVAVLEG